MTIGTGVITGVSISHTRASVDELERSAARSQRAAVATLLDDPAVEDAYVLAAELTDRASTVEALRRYARRRYGRGRALARRTPTDECPCSPDARSARFHDVRELRAALLRTFFARRVPAVSADVEEYL